jgi:hypothetical protein
MSQGRATAATEEEEPGEHRLRHMPRANTEARLRGLDPGPRKRQRRVPEGRLLSAEAAGLPSGRGAIAIA